MSALVHTAELSAKTTPVAPTVDAGAWDALIAALDTVPGASDLAVFGRERREAGEDVHEWSAMLAKALRDREVHAGLGKVFELSTAAGGNMAFHEIHAALDALKAGATPEKAYADAIGGPDHAWRALRERFEVATAEEERLSDECDALRVLLRDSPTHKTPPELDNPTTRSLAALNQSDLTWEEKKAREAVLTNWIADRDEAEKAAGYQDLHCELMAARERRDALKEEIKASQPPNAGALADWIALIAEDATGADFCSPIGVARQYHEGNEQNVAFARIVNAAAVLGGREDLLTTFDPKVFLAMWNALPGHYFGYGGPAYKDPDAWPADKAPDHAVSVPTALYRKFAECALGREEAKRYDKFGNEHPTVQMGGAHGWDDAIRTALKDDPAEAERLLDALDSRACEPIGSALWKSVEPWRQQAIRKANRELEGSLPSTPTISWIASLLIAGGRFEIVDGRMTIGAKVRHAAAVQPFLAEIDADAGLRADVVATLKLAGVSL